MQENQIEKTQKINLCKDCFNFKTVEVNKNNITHYLYLDGKKVIQGKVSEYGYIRIWFCSKKENICTTKRWAYSSTDASCKDGDF